MDLNGYRLVFEDDFNGTELNTENWRYRRLGADGNAFVGPSQVKVADSCITIKGEYRESGEYGPGWYCADLGSVARFGRGYYECRCRCAHALPGGMWSAFWIQAPHPYEPNLSKGGPGSAELDIFECYTGNDGVEYFESTIHCAGMKKRLAPSRSLDSLTFVRFVPDNLSSEFHTFGLDWNEKDYTVYMDGVALASTHWGDGTSAVPSEVCLSICAPGNPDFTTDHSYTLEYVVDSVRIWQKEEQ